MLIIPTSDSCFPRNFKCWGIDGFGVSGSGGLGRAFEDPWLERFSIVISHAWLVFLQGACQKKIVGQVARRNAAIRLQVDVEATRLGRAT